MLLTLVAEAAGVLILLFTFTNVFYDIFHPTRSGSLSDFVGKAGSRLCRHSRLRPAVGPAALVAVILCWVALITVGFALIYFPLIPNELTASGASGTAGERVLRSLAMSLGCLDTFQTFGVEARSGWLKLLVAIEGLIGISMITASVSWLVLVYPALERTRFLAKKTFLLLRAMDASGVADLSSGLLREMADRVIQARIDLVLFPILFNFYAADRSQTLALALPHLEELALRARDKPGEELRLAAVGLEQALDDFAQMLADRVLSTKSRDTATVFRDFAARED